MRDVRIDIIGFDGRPGASEPSYVLAIVDREDPRKRFKVDEAIGGDIYRLQLVRRGQEIARLLGVKPPKDPGPSKNWTGD